MSERYDYDLSYGDGKSTHSELDRNLSQTVERSAARVGARVAEELAKIATGDTKTKKRV